MVIIRSLSLGATKPICESLGLDFLLSLYFPNAVNVSSLGFSRFIIAWQNSDHLSQAVVKSAMAQQIKQQTRVIIIGAGSYIQLKYKKEKNIAN